MAVTLKINDIECSYGAVKVLNGLTFSISSGSFTGIIGPNGSGKSTLLKSLSRVLKPVKGTVLLNEKDLYRMGPQEVAKKMAVVPQETAVNFSFTVKDIVIMGRSPHLGRFQNEGEKDFAAARQAMALTGTLHLADRLITAVSGGERQRVIIARALTQEPEIILLDEPTSHLDINHQVEILSLLQRLNRENNLTIISVFHDLNLAAQYCDSLILMKKGAVFTVGEPAAVLTSGNIKEVYGASVLVRKHPVTGRPSIILLGRDSQIGSKGGRIHVVCGGGAGAPILGLLAGQGYELSAGVLNAGDVDWETARFLDIRMAEEIPFLPVSEQSHQENIKLLTEADVCILVNIPFGRGNLKNLEAVSLALEQSKPVLIIEGQDIKERDFTDGKAEVLYNGLKEKGALVLRDEAAVLNKLRDFF
ncbi:MAG: putative siderophore transport system ATP-binding protein YusV [Firmicutes bacterium ADurb.Bin373]|nr:heme ABC transporter ATP-binding protein [Bacillota bacterium]OQA10454.1 MAG: putative siderophore transport system ATP-binding protein YusV [Firmicutes bacterium ADurb.Bin373]